MQLPEQRVMVDMLNSKLVRDTLVDGNAEYHVALVASKSSELITLLENIRNDNTACISRLNAAE